MFIEENCDLCGDCVFLCPYVDYDREESISQFRRLMEGETPEIVGQCVTCVACNQFCDKGANPFDLILARQEETGVLDIPEQNTEVFRNMPNAPSQVIAGEAGRPVLSLCSVGDFIPGLFEGPLTGLPVTRVSAATHELLSTSSAGIVASGTATVEAALMDLPMVVVYRLSPLTYALGRPFVRVPHYAMANLIAGRKVVTELIQGDFRPERVVGEVEALLAGPRRQDVLSGLAEVRGRLGPPGASARAAEVVARLMV
jgi:hypothetical protein